MEIIKRSGVEVTFDLKKIIAAIGKANDSVKEEEQLTEDEIDEIAMVVADHCEEMNGLPAWRRFRIWWRTSS